MRATYPRFTLEGLVDGVLGHVFGGIIDAPYLIVVEATRGLEAQNPQAQLYGTMLAAAWQNQQRHRQKQQKMYGCYTIGDIGYWIFVGNGHSLHYPISNTQYLLPLNSEGRTNKCPPNYAPL